MKKLLLGFIISLIGTLAGGILLCFPQLGLVPFAIVLIGIGLVVTIGFGMLSIIVYFNQEF